MRELGRTGLAGVVACLALVAAAPALGATYCVHTSGSCAAGQVDEGSDLQQALNDGAATDSTVLVGPGTYTHSGGFNVSTTHDLNVVGAGRGQAILHAGGTGSTVLNFSASLASTISGMTFVLDSHATLALDLSQSTASDVEDVLAPDAVPGAEGAFLTNGAVLRDSTMAGDPRTSAGAGVQVGTGTPLIDHDVLSGYYGVEDLGAPAKLQRSRLTGKYPMEAALAGSDLIADDNLVVLGPGGVIGVSVENGGSATVRSTTITTTANGTGVVSTSSSSGDHTTLTLLDSIVWGFGEALASQSFAGTVATTANYDDLGGSISGGTNATISTSNDINGDPLFADAAGGDYRLRFGSPAIDAGGDCLTVCQTVPDLAGVTRPVDGNGDGVATRDMGAYEYARRAPTAVASVDRTTALTGELLAFSGAGSSDPDPGDALTYAWSFDDGTTASGQDVTHAFTTAGPHTATLTVTDPTALTATAAATVTVAAPPVVKDTVAPTLSKVSLSPSTFAVASGSTATIARRHRGTRIRFTLSEAAKVVATFERRTTGVRSGRRCVARSRTHRHGKACTRYVSAGTLTRRSEPAGADSIAFTGRLGKHRLVRGHYRMRLRATDPAGNRSAEKKATFRIV